MFVVRTIAILLLSLNFLDLYVSGNPAQKSH